MRSYSLRNYRANRHSRLTSSVSLRLTASRLRARSRFGSESPLGFHSLPNRASRPSGEAFIRRCVFSSSAVFRLPASPVAADCRRYGETRCRRLKTGLPRIRNKYGGLEGRRYGETRCRCPKTGFLRIHNKYGGLEGRRCGVGAMLSLQNGGFPYARQLCRRSFPLPHRSKIISNSALANRACMLSFGWFTWLDSRRVVSAPRALSFFHCE